MTEHRHLKRRVRDRMARTGESYSTARRHVLVQTGSEQPAEGRHRISALVRRMLPQPLSEAMVCGLGGGIGFMYAVFEYASIPPLLTIVAQHHPEPWLPAVLNRLGIGFSESHNGNVKRAMAELRADLANGLPSLCTIGREAPQLPTDPYPVVVTGAGDGTIDVDDGVMPQHSVPEADFARAWSSHRKGRHHRITVDPEAKPRGLETAIPAALAVTVAHLTGPVLGNSFDVNFGFSGMSRLAAQLRDERTKSGWAKRFAEPGAYAWAMMQLHDCLELEYTAPGATRPLYAAYLDEASAILNEPRLAEAAVLLRESGASWSRLAGIAAETADGMGEVTALAKRRMEVVMTAGHAGAAEISALTAQIAAAGASGPDPAQLAELASLAERARDLEEQAILLLTV